MKEDGEPTVRTMTSEVPSHTRRGSVSSSILVTAVMRKSMRAYKICFALSTKFLHWLITS